MATKGGSAGSVGYDYQTWFVALKLVDAFFDENIKVQPEAKFVYEPNLDENDLVKISNIKRVIVDDVIVYKNDIPTYYNIKYIAPQLDKWKVSDLNNQGVLPQIVKQFKNNSQRKIVFVSQSPCNLFGNVFTRIKNSPNVAGIKLLLASQKNEKEYKDFKKYSVLTDNTILKLSKVVEYEHGYNTEEYKKIIFRNLKNEVTYSKGIANSLYQLAKEACNKNQIIERNDIINWFEKDSINIKSKLSSTEIVKNFKRISSPLIAWKNTFGDISKSHVERGETRKILDWVHKPLNSKEKSILLVVGNAGTGKTIILKDVITKLQNQRIAAVALKSDLYSVENFNELNIKLNLSDNFEKLLTTLAEKRKTILLIDQIDALSQSLSSDRGAIEFYYSLITRLSFVPNLKIIVSCRSYDLNFDPLLQQLDVKEKVKVGNLSMSQIESIISRIELKIENLPPKLVDILENAQNLNIFCSIYNKELKLNELGTLQDLYSELWRRKITIHQSETNDLVKVVSEISKEMDDSQKISIPMNYYEDKYSKQLKYLTSEGILVLVDKKRVIQFFHQSFFDYCFARTFVNSRKNLFQHITNIHQGLFIRALIKQVMSYLRGTDEGEYLLQLESFLKSKQIRFHIKLMIINQLGFEENPIDGEWEIVKKYILKNSLFEGHFLESIHSRGWFDRLEKQKLVKTYVTGENKKLANSCVVMFYNLIDIEPELILSFMLNVSDFDNKAQIISNILFSLKDWTSTNSIKLFEEIKDNRERDYEFRLGHILEKTMDYHIDWTIEIINEYINERVQKYISEDKFSKPELFGYELEKVFEKLYKKYPEAYFNIVFPLVMEISKKTKLNFSKKYFNDASFYSYDRFELHYSHWKLYDWSKEYIQNIALNNKIKFFEFVKISKYEYSITVINLIIAGLLMDTKFYKNEIFNLLIKRYFLSDIGISHNVGELINKTYPFFTKRKKEQLNEIILFAESEKLSKNENKEWKGISVYELLNSIPLKERVTFPIIQKKYLELKRKFGKINKEKHTKSFVSSVGPALPQIAYEKMSFEQWLDSFKEYNEKTDWGARYQNKRGVHFGGLMEHSRMFGIKVKNNPNRFYPFIVQIINEIIAPNYLAEGLGGLLDANYSLEKICVLIKRINKRSNSIIIRNKIIKGIEYLAKQNILDSDLVKIICDYAINDPDPKQETWQIESEIASPYYGGDPLTAGINTIRGSAAFALVKLGNIHPYKEEIFETLEQIAKDKSVAVKCSAIANLNVLVHLDKERVFKIFLKLTKDLNEEVLRNGIGTFGFYIKGKHSLLHKHIKQSLKISGNHGYQSVQHFMGQLLMYLYVNGVRGSKDFLDRALKNSDERKAGALHYSMSNLTASKLSVRTKARNIFKEFLNSDNQSIQNEYWRVFKEFKGSDFNDLYSLIIKYSQVKGQNRREKDSLYEYLLLCVNDEPKKCINILDNMIKNYLFDTADYSMNEKPVKLLIGAYNKFSKYSTDNIYAKKAMDIFDKMLSFPTFKVDVDNVLKTTDYD